MTWVAWVFISLVVDLMHFGQFPVSFTCPADKTSSRPLLLAWVSYFGHQIPIIPYVEKKKNHVRPRLFFLYNQHVWHAISVSCSFQNSSLSSRWFSSYFYFEPAKLALNDNLKVIGELFEKSGNNWYIVQLPFSGFQAHIAHVFWNSHLPCSFTANVFQIVSVPAKHTSVQWDLYRIFYAGNSYKKSALLIFIPFPSKIIINSIKR